MNRITQGQKINQKLYGMLDREYSQLPSIIDYTHE